MRSVHACVYRTANRILRVWRSARAFTYANATERHRETNLNCALSQSAPIATSARTQQIADYCACEPRSECVRALAIACSHAHANDYNSRVVVSSSCVAAAVCVLCARLLMKLRGSTHPITHLLGRVIVSVLWLHWILWAIVAVEVFADWLFVCVNCHRCVVQCCEKSVFQHRRRQRTRHDGRSRSVRLSCQHRRTARRSAGVIQWIRTHLHIEPMDCNAIMTSMYSDSFDIVAIVRMEEKGITIFCVLSCQFEKVFYSHNAIYFKTIFVLLPYMCF